MKIEWYRIKPAMKTTKLNLDDLRNPETQRRYKEEVKNRLENMIATTAQEKWTSIQKACKEAAENTLEKKVRTQQIENEEIKELSEKQSKLRNEINSSKSEKEKVAKRKERNATLKEIHQKIEEEENNKIIKQVEDIEKYKDDSRRMYRVVRKLQRKEPKKKILVDSDME